MIKKIIIALLFSVIAQTSLAYAPVVDYSSSDSESAEPHKIESNIENNIIGTNEISETSVSSRINNLEQKINNFNQQDFAGKIEELQERVQKLNGQLEEQIYKIEQLSKQIIKPDKTDKPKQKPQTQKPVATTSNNSTGSESEIVEILPQPNTTETPFVKEQQNYQSALNLLPSKKYEESANKFHAYLKEYPKGTYAANAHYWLGEINFLQKNYDVAEEEFKTVTTKYPKFKRMSDAALKLALVHNNQGHQEQANTELKHIIAKYPSSQAAQIAKTQLDGN